MSGATCWTESGGHFFVKQSDTVWVCQTCGEVREIKARSIAGASGD